MSFSLTGRLALDTSGYEQGLAKADLAYQRFSGVMDEYTSKQIGKIEHHFWKAAGVFAAERWIDKISERMHQISEGAAKFGVSAEKFQAMEFASKETGVPIEDLAKNLEKLPIDAREAAVEFERLGRAIPADTVRQFVSNSRAIEDIKKSFERILITGGGPKPTDYMGFGSLLSFGLGNRMQAINAAMTDAKWLLNIFEGTGLILPTWLEKGIKKFAPDLYSNPTTDVDQQELEEREEVLKEHRTRRRIKESQIDRSPAPEERGRALERFDPLNRIGGFAQGADTAVSRLDRIAKATEEIAANTRQNPMDNADAY